MRAMLRCCFLAATLAVSGLSVLLAQADDAQAQVLTGEQILAQLVGNTATGVTSDGFSYEEYYREDGRIRGNGYYGTWRIDGDSFCGDYDGTSNDGCWGVMLEGSTITWLKNGEPDGTSRLLQGNPKGL